MDHGLKSHPKDYVAPRPMKISTGIEPGTFGSRVKVATDCATGANFEGCAYTSKVPVHTTIVNKPSGVVHGHVYDKAWAGAGYASALHSI